MSKITEAGTHLRPVQKVMGIEQEKSNALLPQTWVVRGYTNVSCVCVDPFTSFSSTADTISGQVSFIFVCVYSIQVGKCIYKCIRILYVHPAAHIRNEIEFYFSFCTFCFFQLNTGSVRLMLIDSVTI